MNHYLCLKESSSRECSIRPWAEAGAGAVPSSAASLRSSSSSSSCSSTMSQRVPLQVPLQVPLRDPLDPRRVSKSLLSVRGSLEVWQVLAEFTKFLISVYDTLKIMQDRARSLKFPSTSSTPPGNWTSSPSSLGPSPLSWTPSGLLSYSR